NGNTSAGTTIYLSGFVADGGVFVLANSGAGQAILERANQLAGGTWFNGDDAVVLSKNGVIIDVIGRIGEDPGTEWGSGLTSTADNTLRRKPTICRGDADGQNAFDPAIEWDGFPTDTIDGLGSHSSACGANGITPIRNIQYSTLPSGDSPFKDQTDVTTEGIVTAVFTGSYVLQSGAGEWSGLWIFDGAHAPNLGDRLRLTGTVREVNGLTVLTDLSAYQLLSTANALPAPSLLTAADAAQEQWEGVLLRINNVTVDQSDLGNGEWSVRDGSGLLRIGRKAGYGYFPVAESSLAGIIGVMGFSSSQFKLEPRSDEDILQEPSFRVVINEILADPADDANQNGVVETYADEFVELVNLGTQAADLSGLQLKDASSVRHVFPAGTLVHPGGCLVVFGGGTPNGDFGGAIVQTATSGRLELNNSGDTVQLLNGEQILDTVTYGSEGNSDQSLTRDPDGTGNWVKHRSAARSNDQPFSPGRRADGSSFLSTYIHDIQGKGDVSPYNCRSDVTVEGVVVGSFQGSNGLGGFFLQEETHQADDDPSTSEGLFVYCDTPTVTAGEFVRVTGTVSEFYGRTQLYSVVSLLKLGTAALPNPAIVTLPVASHEDWERYEGMRVTISTSLSITGLGNWVKYGEVELAANDRLYVPTQVASPGTAAQSYKSFNDRSRIQLDDGNRAAYPSPIPHMIAGQPLRVGTMVSSLTGVLDYSYSCYEILPTEALNFIDANPRSNTPLPVDGALKVAALNVDNFFNGDGLGGGFPTSRGAASFEEYQRQKQKLVRALCAMDAEIVGLIEIENDGFGPNSALHDLVGSLNSVLGPDTYRFIDLGLPRVGTDEIANAVIYKPAAVEPCGAPKLLDHSVDPDFDEGTRPSIAQTFQDGEGDRFTFVVNHFRSKKGECAGDPDLGDGQGACNQTRCRCTAALIDWLSTDPTGSGDPDFLIMGDLNAYAQEDPLKLLTTAGYRNEIDRFQGSSAYTYIYDSQAGCLDHALASPNLDLQITGLTIWHINADEAPELDYRSANPEGLFSESPFRSSDHDPVIVGLDLHDPISVKLVSFGARQIDEKIQIVWETETEPNLAGFHLYRSPKREAAFARITESLIKNKGDSTTGARYEWYDLQGNQRCAYKLELIGVDGRSRFEGPITVLNSFVAVSLTPTDYALLPPYPNPFNNTVALKFTLPIDDQAALVIYSLRGEPIRTLCSGRLQAGHHILHWDGSDESGKTVASGLYFCRLETPSFRLTRKIALVR
ncbi:MAG: ExeM/NucH family extracellular endonuclease, partial [candidate division KSB1 bacterium]|nr:ExeM/NucH family extracellular endonuclease [candidate division KSB1 bacterium]